MAQEQVSNKLIYANLMLRAGDADGLVSGAITHTADVLRPAFQIVKMKEGINKVSSVFIMESPNENYGENGFLVFADCGVNPNPTAEELAEIAIVSSETAKSLCGMTPRVALLSYSTHSGDEMKDPNVLKIKEALKIVKEKSPDLIIDGEIGISLAEHKNNARPSTQNKHEKGQAQRKREKFGGEKGDKRRPYHKWKRNANFFIVNFLKTNKLFRINL